MMARRTLPWILLLCVTPQWSHALTGHAVVDSADVARAAWREAAKANRADDLAGTRDWVKRAVRAWPEQVAYLQALARLDARAGDTLALASTLTRLALLGSGATVVRDSVVRALSASGPAQAALEALGQSTAPLAASAVWATLSDSTIFPEGADADASSGTVYVGSIRHRTVFAVEQGGNVRDLRVSRWPAVGAVMGVRFDPKRKVLWATTCALPAMANRVPADSAIAALLKINPSDGSIVSRFDAPGGGHILGDLAVDPSGEVFVTDSQTPVVYRLAERAAGLVPFRHVLFRSLQGVAPAPGGIVYLADYSHGMLRWDTEDGEVTRLPAPEGTTTLGIDGIVLHRHSIYAVQNGVQPPRIVRMDLDPGGTRIVGLQVLDRHWPLADEPTILTVMGERLIYVANSQWEKYDDDGVRRPHTVLARPVLLELPLR